LGKKLMYFNAICLILMAGPLLAADRIVEGTVFYKGGEPAAEAAVQIEDRVTLQVISHLTDKQGHYHFEGLSQDKDYEVRATKKGYWSKPHTVSHFSSRASETVDLTLKPQN
jgi:hypothetical protein